MSEHIYTTEQDFSAWASLINGKIHHKNSSIIVDSTLNNGVSIRFEFIGIVTRKGERYYANGSEYDTVRLAAYADSNYSLKGKGARSMESIKEARNLLSLLSSEF